MQKYLGGPEDPFPAKFHISGRFRPNNRSHHQNSKNLKKSRFSSKKIDFFLRVYIDLYDGICAEIGLQGCLKCFLSKIRYLQYFWTTFGKIEKIDFFRSPAEYRFSGRKSAGNPFIPSYLLPKKMECVRSVNFGFSIKKCVRPPFWPK